MGYDVHITRRARWSDRGNDITLGEWIAFVEASPDMNLTGYAETKVGGGEILRITAEGLTTWTGYAGRSGANGPVWFNHSRGEISVKNPDTETLMKMWSIAQHFAARVQGDEGEAYDELGNALA
jgi:hypothetical protein